MHLVGSKYVHRDGSRFQLKNYNYDKEDNNDNDINNYGDGGGGGGRNLKLL